MIGGGGEAAVAVITGRGRRATARGAATAATAAPVLEGGVGTSICYWYLIVGVATAAAKSLDPPPKR
jgi:hypothetical protein